ncbi:uncharacterized protein A4U43_C08F1010 [Asparagus officinalis]|uniref:myb-related protein 308-like n=1 Tax=Asparagus officinalis TaxID=4686 RepID=UPI00098E3BD0|nr:myb-related protein 308-like [Asparagus officinalis]ONK58913.1 uncharacterized protein A4U43_C08F1010 [Asparagus officinalis]
MKRGRRPEGGLKRGAWTSQEDKVLSDYISAHGLGRWRSLPMNAGLNRCGKSCRLRWLNYLRPDIKRGNITEEEEELIVRLHKLLGNRWSLIAGRLPGRTDNEIKNYWNTYLRKKVTGEASEKKNTADDDPVAKKKEKSDGNVIRTRATRCTRPILTDQVRKPITSNDASDGLVPTALAPDFQDFNGHTEYPLLNGKEDGSWINVDVMQNLIFSQVPRDSSNASTESLQSIADAEISFDEENYARELYSLLDTDSWDSLVVSRRA